MKALLSQQRMPLGRRVLVALLSLATAAGVAELVYRLAGLDRVGVLFLAAVLATAIVAGRTTGLVTAAGAAALYNLFLVPRYTLHISLEDGLNLTIFFVVALITGDLAGKVRESAQRLEFRARMMEILFAATRELSSTADEATMWRILRRSIADASGSQAAVIVDKNAHEIEGGPVPAEARELAARALESAGKEQLHSAGRWFAKAVLVNGNIIGAVVWKSELPPDAPGESSELFLALADLCGSAVGRARVSDEKAKLEAEAQGHELREALISSVSHDFRSPLSAIIGSSTSILEYGDRFPPEVTKDLLLNIQEQGERLNRFVENLLNFGRLRAGALELHLEQVDLHQICVAVHDRATSLYPDRKTVLRAETEITALADPLLLDQALFNVVENALKFSGGNGEVVLGVGKLGGCAIIEITDSGPGIAPEDRVRVFERFQSAATSDGTQGSGLGLFISKGFVEAIGGRIEAAARADGKQGLRVTITLPAGGQE